MPTDSSNGADSRRLVALLCDLATRAGRPSIKVMEVCGTHTVTAQAAGLPGLLPQGVRLIAGPGCPVCVTPAGYIDQAATLALDGRVHVMTYGDMVRVPGIKTSLEEARRRGGKVSVVYSVTDALEAARRDRSRDVVFLGIGFETTAPASAFAAKVAREEGLENFSLFSAHKRIIPAMEALLADPELAIDGFIAPGHVSVVIGTDAYEPLVGRYHRPCVVAGFTGEQMLLGLVRVLTQMVSGKPAVESVYASRVTPGGNEQAVRLIDEVFEVADSRWRGLGAIGSSGLELRDAYAAFDARRRYGLGEPEDCEPAGCRCAEVIKGCIEPVECPLFGVRCTPLEPVGACMVSREGACSAFYKYRKVER